MLLSAHLDYNPMRGAIIHKRYICPIDDCSAVYAD
jgi:hypothetical protein